MTRRIIGLTVAGLIVALSALSARPGNPQSTAIADFATGQAAPDYTIAVMPDVQIYSRDADKRHIHTDVADWLASEAVTRNIRMVMYPGDLVEYGSTHGADSVAEWDAVEAGVDVLDAAGLPYTLAVGNHDYDSDWGQSHPPSTVRDTLTFNARFGPARHASHAWWIGGEFEPGKADNAYIVQNIGGRRVLFMALEFGPRQAVVDWANRVLTYHAEKPAFVITHSYAQWDNTRVGANDTFNAHTYPGHPDTHDGDELWTELFRHHGNVIAVFSGHQIQAQNQPYSIGRVADTGDRGNPVAGLLFNLQDQPGGGSGYIRLVTVSEAAGTIDVETYSPLLDAHMTGDRHAFTLSYAPILSPATTTATAALPTSSPAPTSTPTATPTPTDVDARSMLATVGAQIADYLTRVPAVATTALASATPTPTNTPTRTPTTEATTMAILDNIAAYYKLDESSGNAVDALATSDLTASGSAPGATTGKVGGCRTFAAASSQMFSRADNAALSTGDIDFTIAGWVYLASKPGATMDIMSRYDGGLREYLFVWQQSTDRFFFSIEGSAGSTSVISNNFGAPSTGTWYFVVAWHDSVANTVNISVNNGTANSASTGANVASDTAATTTLGGRNGGGRFWDGRLDEVGFWKRVLTAAERTLLYNGGAGLSYPFGGGSLLASNVFESPIFGGLAVR